jgi:peptidoglycan hydrolase CwlO-like protein
MKNSVIAGVIIIILIAILAFLYINSQPVQQNATQNNLTANQTQVVNDINNITQQINETIGQIDNITAELNQTLNSTNFTLPT